MILLLLFGVLSLPRARRPRSALNSSSSTSAPHDFCLRRILLSTRLYHAFSRLQYFTASAQLIFRDAGAFSPILRGAIEIFRE